MRHYISKTLRKKDNRLIFVIFTMVLLFSSCQDFFEKDLSGIYPTVILPSDGTIQTNTNVSFIWQEVKGATGYQFIVGSPTLASPGNYYLDSTVTGTEFTLGLFPESFEWKMRGVNNASYTNYITTRQLQIDSSYDLGGQTILLYTPTDSYYTNDSTVTFTWQNLYSADSYNFVLKQGSSWNTATQLESQSLAVSQYTSSNVFSEGEFLWSVRGENTLPSNTPYATEFTLYIDQTNPADPIGVSPSSSTLGLHADSSYLFNWTRPVDPGTIHSSLYDSVYIFSDTLQAPINSYYSLAEDTTLTLPSATGTYYWRVVTFDKAGNYSQISNVNSFLVQ